MPYTKAQLDATKTYITNYFSNKFMIWNLVKKEFSVKLNLIFNEIETYQPEKFEFNKKNRLGLGYFIDWVDEKEGAFPDDFNVILTCDGNSIHQAGKIPIVIYSQTKTNTPVNSYSLPVLPASAPARSTYLPSVTSRSHSSSDSDSDVDLRTKDKSDSEEDIFQMDDVIKTGNPLSRFNK
jgi:hypothetical protein